jgi:hypothetical protein
MVKPKPTFPPAILEVVENQLRENNPPETKQTLQRLIKEGYSLKEAKELIGVVLFVETVDVLNKKRDFDEAGYVAALQQLPKLPSD